jgi:2-polyprenyl-3-methyl-5-hydroxy-6-metoxy-1,4-benzoquinol methylase
MRLAAYDCDEHPEAETPYIAWEETDCLLCGCNAWIPCLEAADRLTDRGGLRFLIVRCLQCGLCFTNPRPDPDSIRQFYPGEYSCHHAKAPSHRRRFRRDDPIAALLPRGRLLDFGCGAGDFMQRMHSLGWNVIGLDAADPAVKRIRDQLHLPALAGTLPQEKWDDGSFDAITMWQALEHTHQPLEVLRDAHRLLAPKGRLIVTVPNFEGLSSCWFGSNWIGLDVPRHLTHFTAETLRGMLQRAGFSRMAIHQEHRGSWMRRSARLSIERRQVGLLTPVLQSRIGSRLAGWWARWSGRGDSLFAIADK